MKNKYILLILIFAFTNLTYFVGNTQGPQAPTPGGSNDAAAQLAIMIRQNQVNDSMDKVEKKKQDSLMKIKDSIKNSLWMETELLFEGYKDAVISPKRNLSLNPLDKNTIELPTFALKGSMDDNTIGYLLGFWIGVGNDMKMEYEKTGEALGNVEKYMQSKAEIRPLLQLANVWKAGEEVVNNGNTAGKYEHKRESVKYTLIVTDKGTGQELMREEAFTCETFGVIHLPLFAQADARLIFENPNQMTALKVNCKLQMFKHITQVM